MLRDRRLVALLAAEIVSSLGSHMTYLALPWFVLVTTGSPARMTVVLAVQMLPIALFGIPSGTLVSRLGARRTMLLSDWARAPLMASIPVLHTLDLLSFPVLLVCVFGIGCFVAPYFSSQRVILPELVGDDERTVGKANAIVEGAQRATSLLGPSAAGVLIAVVGATNVLYIDAATFLFAALTLTLFVPQRPPVAPTAESGGLLAGVRYLMRDRILRTLGITALVLNGFGQMMAAGLPVLAYQDFGGSSRVAGVFFASFGAGAVVGSLLAVKALGRFDPLRLGAVALVAITLPVFVLVLDLPAWAIVAALFTSSLFGPLVNAPLIAMITTRTPAALRAKVMTSVLTFALLAGPVGLVVAGPILQAWGPHPVFGIIAAGQLAAALFFASVALREPRQAPMSVPAADTPA
jgi:predicted MFS family arabinose efflux permease